MARIIRADSVRRALDTVPLVVRGAVSVPKCIAVLDAANRAHCLFGAGRLAACVIYFRIRRVTAGALVPVLCFIVLCDGEIMSELVCRYDVLLRLCSKRRVCEGRRIG